MAKGGTMSSVEFYGYQIIELAKSSKRDLEKYSIWWKVCRDGYKGLSSEKLEECIQWALKDSDNIQTELELREMIQKFLSEP